MEQQDPPEPDTQAERQPIRAEDLVFDQDPPTLEEGASPDAIHVSVRLDLDVWRWLLAQGGDYHIQMNTLLRAQMDASGAATHKTRAGP
jgi:uncharacterized protein (DUF4415 family)